MLAKFQEQLNLDLGLHQIISKIETFDTMLDENLLPDDLKEELNRINQLVEDTESDFRAMLPQSMGDRSYLTPAEIADIKEKEREITERLKDPLKELFELTNRRL